MKKTKKLATMAVIAVVTSALLACERDGPAEQAGERIDEAGRHAVDAVQGINEGPAERAGRKLDEAAQNAAETIENAGEALKDKAAVEPE
jgi:uncharacterized protein with beta-barrel porin domain